ncbi:sulfite exporter TauE/SafE family protein [Candidatus Dependentiae bacterium]|nr:sulfite exporter TauE/SafE family protein [Candidatus Dependentiae bacterium]MBU4387478.1 sulfite exporter TauE/SafE family protein [Candidatus Dependentiae bacterium]MCG2756495.1 hypothetical protein [Candidatus Dependentiae bacterium]
MFYIGRKNKQFNLGLIIALFLIISGITAQRKIFALNDNITEQTQKVSFFSIQNLEKIFTPEESPVYLLILAFIVGIFTSFTPCVYPMIPITMGILQSQASTSLYRNFLLSVSYVLGMSTIYAIFGYIAATSTVIFGQWLTNPWVVLLVASLFIYLALSMFGFYEIKVPAFMLKRQSLSVKGSYIYSFLFGVVSGTVASPCLTPALAILLSFVAKIGNPIIGFLSLFLFAFGMGILLIVVGTFSASLNILPKAGLWMVEIKKFFGFVLFAMIIYFIQPFLGGFAVYKLYAVLALIVGLYYLIKANNNKIKIFIGLIFIILFLSLTIWIVKEKRIKSSRLLATNLKPDKMLVCLSTAMHKKV